MSGAIPPLPQYAFMAWYLFKAQGQLYLTITLIGLVVSRILHFCACPAFPFIEENYCLPSYHTPAMLLL